MKFKNMKQENFTRLPQFLNPELVVGDLQKLKEPRIIQDWVLWLEQRPNELGRTTILIRPWLSPNCIPQELTPFPINVKTRIHGYGGAPIAISNSDDQLILLFINDCDGCLWRQTWSGLNNHINDLKPKLHKNSSSICLSTRDDSYLADGLVDIERNRWIGVMEKGKKDYLVTFLLDRENQKPKILYEAKDFIGSISMNQNADKLSWIEWQQPFMPWESSYLKIALLSASGDIYEKESLNIKSENGIDLCSFFQPRWLNSQELIVVADNNGWWNLLKIYVDNKNQIQWKRILDRKTEYGLPQWLSGMSTIAINNDNIICLGCEKGTWKMSLLSNTNLVKNINIPFDNISALNSYSNRVIAIVSNPFLEQGLLELDLESGSYNYQSSRDIIFNPKDISKGESFWFKGFNGQNTHAWYYPPMTTGKKISPLIVKAHSGPSAMSGNGLELETQFWTSRGWGVLEVNYGGSTGFGREYRDRLKNKWGEVDAFDCSAAANALVDIGKADKDLIAILGSSAGGFTALNCLSSPSIFSAAACKYPVTNLLEMLNTHRFEEGYLEYLIGPFPKEKDQYIQRSPINNASKINSPVIFFQGKNDQVVSYEQTQKMFEALKKKGLKVEIYIFEDEGHGFKSGITRIKVLKETERFFRETLGVSL